MNIQQILRQQLQRQQSNVQVLRPNQIVQGQIVKLYPENKALIQIGGKQHVAQLDIPLSIGEKYFFQVQDETEYVHLKVLGDAIKQSAATNIDQLLSRLGLSNDRSAKQLVQYLMQEQTPFDSQTIKRLAPMLKTSKQPERALNIMNQMINQQYPLTREIFQSLKLVETTHFSNQLQSVLQNLTELQNDDRSQVQELIQIISRLIKSSSSKQGSQALLQTIQNNQNIFNLFKGLQLMNDEAVSMIEQQAPLAKLLSNHQPFRLQQSSINEIMTNLINRSQLTMQQVNAFLSIWERPLEQVITQQTPMPKVDFITFKQQVKQYFSPILLAQHEQILSEHLHNRVEPLQFFLEALRSLQNESTYFTVQDIQRNSFSPKSEFMQQIQQIMTTVGLSYEHQILNNELSQDHPTLKQTLLQLVQQTDLPINQDRAQQLLHFINGLQLQSIEESNHFMYANLIIPGETLKLNKDLYMQFQSKKTAEETINPNHCRILFLLHLQRLDETIIDMNVQDRIISVNVYNDHNFLKAVVKPLEQTLRERLKTIDYNLSSINFKPLQEQEEKQPVVNEFKTKNFSGVDLRI